jgi:ferric-dicitrate binding protein FerR (iron transport regulator)
MRGASCLRAGKLLAGRRAGLNDAERLWLEEHLQGCEPCRHDARMLAGLAGLADEAAEVSMGERGLARAVQVALREGVQRPALQAARPIQRIVISFASAALVAGALALAWVTWRPGPSAPVAASEPRVVPAGAPVQLAHAEVVLTADGAAEWDAGRTTVHLTRGRVAVRVDRAPHKPFRVATDRFVVEVTGTRFEVAADEV